MGCSCSKRRLRKQVLLCLVWCSNRLHFHHCQLHRLMERLVAEPRQGQACLVHGQGQCSLPYYYVSRIFNWHRKTMDLTGSNKHHWVLELWEHKIFKEKLHRCFWYPCYWCSWDTSLCLEILLVVYMTWELRHSVQMEWFLD